MKTIHNLVVFFISLGALMAMYSIVNKTENLYLPEAPKATQDIQKVFIPPIFRMQWFVFCFDALSILYYVYQWPCWDCIKEKFPFFQYEAKTTEKADCATLLLNIMFNLISKVSLHNSLKLSLISIYFRVSLLESS